MLVRILHIGKFYWPKIAALFLISIICVLKIRRETLMREYDKLKQIMKSEILSSFFPARKIFKVWKWVSGRPKIYFIWPSGHKSWRWYIFSFLWLRQMMQLFWASGEIFWSTKMIFIIQFIETLMIFAALMNGDLLHKFLSFLLLFAFAFWLTQGWRKKMCGRNVSMSVRLRLKIKCDQNRSKILRTVMR